MKALSEGDIEAISTVDSKSYKIILKNVMFIPDLRVNLLSISLIEKSGFKITYYNSLMTIERNNITYSLGKRIGNLYKLTFMIKKNENYANLSVKDDIHLWHQRYGHVNFNTLINIKNKNLVNGLNFQNNRAENVCEICVKSKLKNLPYNSKSVRSNRVLELIHTDVCGPLTPTSYKENKYFLTFIDVYRRGKLELMERSY